MKKNKPKALRRAGLSGRRPSQRPSAVKKKKLEKRRRPYALRIRSATTLGVGVLAVASFAMSFEALRGLALANGMSGWAASLFPLAIDVAILVYSLASYVRRSQGLRATMELGFVITVTLASLILNVMSGAAPSPLLHVIIHGAPPICLAMAVEAAIRMLEAKNKKKKVEAQS